MLPSLPQGAVLLYLGLIRPDSRAPSGMPRFFRMELRPQRPVGHECGNPGKILSRLSGEPQSAGSPLSSMYTSQPTGSSPFFHDDTLSRMCGLNRTVESMNYSELARLRLLNTEHRIPLLSEVLKLVEGRVPLLIEMKLPTRSTRLCPLLDRELAAYSGPYLIESFNPLGLRLVQKTPARRPAWTAYLSPRPCPGPGRLSAEALRFTAHETASAGPISSPAISAIWTGSASG